MKRRVSKIVEALLKREVANCGRWCEITMKKNGDVVRVIRIGCGPMERPEWDTHALMVNGNQLYGTEFKNLYELAQWICDHY